MRHHKTQFLVGTSGWTYDDWQGVFYPDSWPKSRWFEYYAGVFATVEVNATFYRTFQDKTYHKWREQAPRGFSYVLKAPRLITHRKHLLNVAQPLAAFWRSASLLQDKLGLILLQLAPRTAYDPERLRQALLSCEDPRKVAVEFRHPKWLTREIRDLLQETGAVFCSADSPESELQDWVTSKIAYLRLHGRRQWYAYNYSASELQEIAALARNMASRGAHVVYIFFNNDVNGYAVRNAGQLAELLAETG